jgi:hypothetical protein
MTDVIETGLRRLRRRARLATYLGEWSRHLLIASLLIGGTVLLLRVGRGLTTKEAAWALLALVATPVTAWMIARRRFLSLSGAAAWLDLRAGARGLLLTEIETRDERWRSRAEQELERAGEQPGLRSRPVVVRCMGGALFVIAALWIEIPRLAQPGPPPELYASVIEDLREKLETLLEEVELDAESRAELEARLERLEDEVNDARNPEATFEALDRLESRLEEEARRAEQAARAANDALRAAEASGEENGLAMQNALEEALTRLQDAGLDASLPTELGERLAATLQMPGESNFDLSELVQLSEEMRAALEGMLAELADVGLLPAGGLGKLGELGPVGDLSGFEFHECDENCEKPGGT